MTYDNTITILFVAEIILLLTTYSVKNLKAFKSFVVLDVIVFTGTTIYMIVGDTQTTNSLVSIFSYLAAFIIVKLLWKTKPFQKIDEILENRIKKNLENKEN